MRNIKIVFVRYYSSLQRKKYIMPNAMVMQSVPCAHWGCAVNHRCITLNRTGDIAIFFKPDRTTWALMTKT